jgi:hypothetical protein
MTPKLFVRLILATAFCANTLHADPIRVKQSQGTMHGYLALRTESGELIGHGDMIQIAHGTRVTTQLVLHFKDGSIDDETATYTQAGTFHLISDHHIQKGPFFPKPVDYTIQSNGQVALRSTDKDGKEKVDTQQLELPADLSNGIMPALITNLSPKIPSATLGMVVPVLGKGRLIKVSITPAGPQKFTIVGLTNTSDVYRLHMELGGVVGAVAPIVGKQPGDLFIWVAQGLAPQIVRLLGPLAEGSPVVSIELSGASFEHPTAK